jgi:Ca2+-binding EF-hand superfamily protein
MSEADWTAIFDLHDAGMRGVLPKDEVSHVIRSCGRMLLPTQMTELLSKFPSSMSKAHFLEAMRLPVSGEPSEKDVLPALRAFDTKENGELSRFELNQIFTNMEQKLTLEQVSELTKGSPAITGANQEKIDIQKFYEWISRPASDINVEIADVVRQCQ